MPFPVVKVRKNEFERFLRDSADVATLWNADNMEFEQFVSVIPCDVEELMTAIDLFSGHENDYIYIFNSNFDNPHAAWDQVIFDDEKLPEVKAGDLSEYIVRGGSKDFLYFACSLEEASNHQYTTLLPSGFVDDDDDDEGDEDQLD